MNFSETLNEINAFSNSINDQQLTIEQAENMWHIMFDPEAPFDYALDCRLIAIEEYLKERAPRERGRVEQVMSRKRRMWYAAKTTR